MTAARSNSPVQRPAIWIELWGWYGTIAVVGSYYASSHGLMERDWRYHALNFSGSLGIIAISWARRTWQPLTLNLVWALIGAIALIRLAF